MPILLEFERHFADLESKVEQLKKLTLEQPEGYASSIETLREEVEYLRDAYFAKLTPYQRTMLCRHPERPFTEDYLGMAFTDWIELHGDRNYKDDPALIGGMARLDGQPVVVLGHQKGRTAKEIVRRNFGMARPEGFRKALRMMKMAERLNRPLITFVDTPGAYPGIGAEERGQAEAIATSIMTMSALRIPVISVVIGEGGSGGALALCVGNRILMLENSIFSVISPEACASILWRDKAQAPKAAEALRYTAPNCMKIGVADELIPEPSTGAHRDYEVAAQSLQEALVRNLAELRELSADELVADRRRKMRSMGVFESMEWPPKS